MTCSKGLKGGIEPGRLQRTGVLSTWGRCSTKWFLTLDKSCRPNGTIETHKLSSKTHFVWCPDCCFNPPSLSLGYFPGAGQGPPRCGQAAEQPGPAVSEPGQVRGGGVLLLPCPGDLWVQAGPRWSQRGQNQEQPGERRVITTTSAFTVLFSPSSFQNPLLYCSFTTVPIDFPVNVPR